MRRCPSAALIAARAGAALTRCVGSYRSTPRPVVAHSNRAAGSGPSIRVAHGASLHVVHARPLSLGLRSGALRESRATHEGGRRDCNQQFLHFAFSVSLRRANGAEQSTFLGIHFNVVKGILKLTPMKIVTADRSSTGDNKAKDKVGAESHRGGGCYRNQDAPHFNGSVMVLRFVLDHTLHDYRGALVSAREVGPSPPGGARGWGRRLRC
ncbi:hypothetical protein ACVISU_002090 [Bradyrhizobium sp. USDA 4452]